MRLLPKKPAATESRAQQQQRWRQQAFREGIRCLSDMLTIAGSINPSSSENSIWIWTHMERVLTVDGRTVEGGRWRWNKTKRPNFLLLAFRGLSVSVSVTPAASSAAPSCLLLLLLLLLDWTGLDWAGLDWTGLDWVGLDWIGLDWTGLDQSFYKSYT